ncbi:hypothetical protein KC19_VG198200 [Ceratodon purpureus]|uniref:Secreted protein n=1 Tax=Ceratodon purpureus TaxID=3225 RepID=A0A8T0HRS1_CERPU|nr:hypothetical protein KC19_VG198200 [Ceratodon purpureus]
MRRGARVVSKLSITPFVNSCCCLIWCGVSQSNRGSVWSEVKGDRLVAGGFFWRSEVEEYERYCCLVEVRSVTEVSVSGDGGVRCEGPGTLVRGCCRLDFNCVQLLENKSGSWG